jgi:hypothetical protein
VHDVSLFLPFPPFSSLFFFFFINFYFLFVPSFSDTSICITKLSLQTEQTAYLKGGKGWGSDLSCIIIYYIPLFFVWAGGLLSERWTGLMEERGERSLG